MHPDRFQAQTATIVVERPTAGAAGARRSVVELHGDYHVAGVPEIERVLRRRFGPFFRRQNLIIDLGDVTGIDNGFIDFVVWLARDLHAERRELVLARPAGRVRESLVGVGLPNVVPVYESVDEAFAALEGASSPLIPPRFEARPR